MNKNIIKENDKILKIALVLISICFAIPSVMFLVKNKTIYNFNGNLEFCFLLTNNIDRLNQAGVYLAFITAYLLIYFFIIKKREQILKNINQVYIFVLIIALIFLIVLPFWCSDIFYYLGIGRLNSTYHQNPYYVTMKDYYENNLVKPNDTVILKGYNNYWADTTVVYGALWTFICSIVSFLSFGNIDVGVLIFKLFNIAIHLANCYILFKLSKNKLIPLLYGLNPFILIEGIANVHNDMYVVFFILLGLLFLIKYKRIIPAILFLACATCIKYIAILFVPLFIIYHYREKGLKIRVLKCVECGVLFLFFCAVPYLIYARDINVLIGLISQQDKIAKGLFLFINEYFDKPKNIIQIVKNLSLLSFSTLYICKCISLLFTKEIDFKKEMNILFWFLVAFIFLLITNFQPWYLIWLTVFLIWQEKQNIKLIIQMQNMTLIANTVFLVYTENFKYGVPFFFILIVGILICAVLNKKDTVENRYMIYKKEKFMKRLLLIDGNSIMNRAFYGIMGSKMLSTKDGKYTNAVYGFLAIMFKNLEDLNPDYMAVTFDLKAKTARHKLYEGYKANRHGMPDELAEQMPMIKEVLKAMNIDIVELEGFEGDDILGTLSKFGETQGLDVTILSGDRDTFQLATDKVTIRIPRTKQGKTETDEYDKAKVIEEYGLEPKALIEVKGLQGDSSDNIPGVPGIGPKTAINLIKKYGTVENLYKAIEEGTDDLKGKQKETIVQNKEMAFISRQLGEINVNVPLEDTLENLKVEEWDRKKVLELFKQWNFKRYIERFNLEVEVENQPKKEITNLFKIVENKGINEIEEIINKQKRLYFSFCLEDEQNLDLIIKSQIKAIAIYNPESCETYYVEKTAQGFVDFLKRIFENNQIEKYGVKLSNVYILLKQIGITPENLKYDIAVAAYIINPTIGKYPIDGLIEEYLDLNIKYYLEQNGALEENTKQITLFEQEESNVNVDLYKNSFYAYAIWSLSEILTKKLKEQEELELFETIDMPTVEVLANMQFNGMHIEENDLVEFGKTLKDGLDVLTEEIYNIAGEEFNINSPKQLGEILFEKMGLTVVKKTKSGYSTAEDVLEKLKGESPIIEKILDYRQLAKLNSTYVEGMRPYINPKTKRIHSFFHQTITATGRISSTEPNLQNIPTRIELGKRLRKVFTPEEGTVYIDADYSQIELRVLAHMSEDKHMCDAFEKGEDIHKQAASKVLHKPIEEVTKEERSSAKAVNFGIVYGISDFGLGEQLGIGRKAAKSYIDQYLEEYSGIKKYMDQVVEEAKNSGYAKTMYGRRRNIAELQSNNYMVREFGKRAAMNTPIQGTAADIMKIAMIKVYKELKAKNLKSKIVLQVHDEMMIEAPLEEKEQIKQILKQSMETAATLKVPLIAEISEAQNWYDCK